MRGLTDFAVYLVVRICFCVIQSMRIETCDQLARGMAWVATELIPIRRRVIDENLQIAFPEWSAAERRKVARQMWHHLVLMVCEVAHLPRKVHETNWRKFVTFRNIRELTQPLLAQRPTVLVSGHFGNFEMACYMLGLLGVPTFAIARPLDNPWLDRFVTRLRTRTGQRLLPKQGSAEEANRLLESRGALALLGDQHAGPKGCWVDFFGRPASCHKAIAVFSLTSDAPLLVTYAIRRNRPLQFEIGLVGAIDPREPCAATEGVRAMTQWYNERLEEMVRMAPAQYWWLHRRWKGEPPQRVRQSPDSPASRPAA